MTSITPIPDDIGTESLKQLNRTSGAASEVAKIAPYPNIHPARTSRKAQMAAGELSRRLRERPPLVRTVTKRRAGDRRNKQLPVMLDTRDHHERRMDERREESNAGQDKKRGVDIYT